MGQAKPELPRDKTGFGIGQKLDGRGQELAGSSAAQMATGVDLWLPKNRQPRLHNLALSASFPCT